MGPQVFISSTSDLIAERQTLDTALRPRFSPYRYENDRARRSAPQEHCRRMIANSHVLVGVLGPAYGSMCRDDTGGSAAEISIVEWEFRTAQRHDLEIMAFVKEPMPAEQIDPRQQQFIERVRDFRSGYWCKSYRSAVELASLVQESLFDWLVEYFEESNKPRHHVRRFADRLMRAFVTAALLLAIGVLLLVGLTQLQELFSTRSLIAASLCVFVALLLCLVMTLAEKGPLNVQF